MSNKKTIPLTLFKDINLIYSISVNNRRKYAQIYNSTIKHTPYINPHGLTSIRDIDTLKVEELFTMHEKKLDERLSEYIEKVVKLYLIRDKSLNAPLDAELYKRHKSMLLFNDHFTKMTLKIRKENAELYLPKKKTSSVFFYDSKGNMIFYRA